MLRPILLAALALGATPVAAEESLDRLALIAEIVNGLRDGGSVLIGAMGRGAVHRATNGEFDVMFSGPSLSTFVFEEEPDCVFRATVTMAGAMSSVIEFDLNRVSAVRFEERESRNGLQSVRLSFEGEEGIVQLVDQGVHIPMPAETSIVTSLSVAELDEAAASLRTSACPGKGS